MAYTSRMPDNPLRRMVDITKNDTTTYDPPIVLLRVGGAGNVVVTDLEGNDITITSVLAGEYVPGPFSKIKSTNTTASAFTGWKNE